MNLAALPSEALCRRFPPTHFGYKELVTGITRIELQLSQNKQGWNQARVDNGIMSNQEWAMHAMMVGCPLHYYNATEHLYIVRHFLWKRQAIL